MRRLGWKLTLGIVLVILSIIVYLIHWIIFRDPHHIFIYLIGDIAFVFLEVLLVTLIIHKLLTEREKRSRLQKLNMVIGTFFSEAGTRLLAYLSDCDLKLDEIRKDLVVKGDWTEQKFEDVSERLKHYEYAVDIEEVNLEELKQFLTEKNDLMLRLLENPSLLEHESFTELLRAVFHLTDELSHRDDVTSLPESDREHLSGDIKRAYGLLVFQWLEYMRYLKETYPYLFSLAMRTNPFDQDASPIVK